MERPVSGGSQRSEAAARTGSQPNGDLFFWCFITIFVALVVTMVLVLAFVGLPFQVIVTNASLASLDLAVTSNGTGTGTAASSASVAYDLSLTVPQFNQNWAMWVDLTAPLDAELRFAGQRFYGARLADPGMSIPPGGAKEFRVFARSSPAGVPLRGAGVAAELARERAEAVFVVELRIAGQVRYRPVHAGRSSRMETTCPLKMLMPNAPRGAHNMVELQKGFVICY